MKLKLPHYFNRHFKRAAGRTRHAKHSRRHYSVPVGNRSDALYYLEELFEVNTAGFTPDLAIY